MRLIVNGMAREVEEPLTLARFLEEEGEPPRYVVVEVNGEYIPLREYDERVLREGDRIEIILPAFGG